MRLRILLLLLSVSCILGFVRLGIWQIDRADYKEDLLAHARQVLVERKADVLAAAADAPAPDSEADAYEWAAGSGHFLPLPVIRLDNQVRNGIPGIRVYRVFQPDGARHAVLVELGWRPLPSHLDMPAEPAPPAITQVHGLLSPPPVPGISLGGSAIQRQPDGSLLLIRLDPDKLAPELKLAKGLAPRVLRLDPSMRVGYKRDLAVLSGTLPPEQHRGYAVQWFGMAIALLVTTIVVMRRKPQRKTDPNEESAG
ncbi:MAG TPA: SURF1 family protein [Xanthomonadaceae bacterium]|nr:SURF1 family protein [Xanthomonadaceae bacterium]